MVLFDAATPEFQLYAGGVFSSATCSNTSFTHALLLLVGGVYPVLRCGWLAGYNGQQQGVSLAMHAWACLSS